MLKVVLVVALSLLGAVSSERRVTYLHIISEIQARFAITDVLSQVENTDSFAQEVFFRAILPPDAFITSFSLEVDGKIIPGIVKEKDEARDDYDRELIAGRTAGLVEKARDANEFEIAVNVAAKGLVTFNLTYQEVLKREHGAYKHVVNIMPEEEVDDIQADILIAEREPLSKLHVPEFGMNIGERENDQLLNMPEAKNIEKRRTSDAGGTLAYVYFIPPEDPIDKRRDGQLVVLYDVERDTTGGEIEVMDGYFVHFFAPTNIPEGDKHVVFALDKSGSMKGRKMQQMKTAMETILKELHPTDYFDVLLFSGNVKKWRDNSVAASDSNKQSAIDFINDQKARGGTNIMQALEDSYEILRADSSRPLVSMIIFLTDGKATVGEKNSDAIVQKMADLNQFTDFSMHGISFGRSSDYKLMKRISADNHGVARYIFADADATQQLVGFYKSIATPLLKDMNIRYIGRSVDVSSLVEENADIYYDGGEMVTFGKLNDPSTTSVGAMIRTKAKNRRKTFVAVSDSSRGGTVEAQTCFPAVSNAPFASGKRPKQPNRIPLCGNGLQFDDGESNQGTPRPMVGAATVGGFIERMWAYKNIKKLINSADIEFSDTKAKEYRDEALRLSLKYGFVTPLTSMVVVIPNSVHPERTLEDNPKRKTQRAIDDTVRGSTSPSPGITAATQLTCDVDLFILVDRAMASLISSNARIMKKLYAKVKAGVSGDLRVGVYAIDGRRQMRTVFDLEAKTDTQFDSSVAVTKLLAGSTGGFLDLMRSFGASKARKAVVLFGSSRPIATSFRARLNALKRQAQSFDAIIPLGVASKDLIDMVDAGRLFIRPTTTKINTIADNITNC